MAIGDIGTIVDTLEFDTSRARNPDVIYIATGIYAVVYKGVDSDGWLKTFSVSTAGNIGDTVIDSFEFAPNIGVNYPKIVHVSGDIYAIAYGDGTNDEGRIVTVGIDSSGSITNPVVDGPNTFTTNIDTTQKLDFIKVAEGMYAVVYQDDGNDGNVSSVGISAAGTIDANATDTLEFETDLCTDFCMIKAGGDIVAIAFQNGTDDELTLITVEITSVGAVADAVVDTLKIADRVSTEIFYPEICHVSGDYKDSRITSIGTCIGNKLILV